MSNKIESFSHIHKTCIDFCTVPHEVVDGLECSPGAHGGGAAWLIGKLKMVDTKGRTKEEEDDPVQELQYQTTQCN